MIKQQFQYFQKLHKIKQEAVFCNLYSTVTFDGVWIYLPGD